MALASLRDITLTFGGHPLFDGLSLHIEVGDRYCLLGRNGEGKSTLMKVLAGQQAPDSGEVSLSRGLKIAFLDQDLPLACPGTLGDFVAKSGSSSHIAASFISSLGLDPTQEFASLSGGAKRRALLARELSREPELILLDEPTNHLDMESIEWLEDWLSRQTAAVLFVTHDRAFARRTANRIAELDRGKLYSFKAGYDEFILKREELLAAEANQRVLFDKKLAQEEVWIRKGIKARRTRDEGRVKALEKMREEARQRRSRQASVKLNLESARRSGDIILETNQLSFSWPEKKIADKLDILIERGDRIGIVGPNGSGKTSLMRLLLGDLVPDSGSIKTGAGVKTLVFDQLRAQLDPERTVAENIAGSDDAVLVAGRLRHINAYLQDFLFSPERARNPVSILSGGEKNRLLLAKLFTQSANFLILDEPTNDLDSDTLDLLEDLLAEFSGTLLVISHDRDFLDNVVSSLFIMGTNGQFEEFVGSWSEWKQRQKNLNLGSQERQNTQISPEGKKSERQTKLSYKEGKELETLPALIAELETKISQLHSELANPDLYKSGLSQGQKLSEELSTCESKLEEAYERWDILEKKQTSDRTSAVKL